MNQKTITAECRELLKNAPGQEELTVIIRPKFSSVGEQEARMVMNMLKGEEMATKRQHLLAKVNGRYGRGESFCRNFKDSRLKAQEKLQKAAPRANSLWMADAVAVSGTSKEIEDLIRHEDVEKVDINPTFRLPEVFQTPLESTTTVVDGSAWGLAKILAPEVWGGFSRGRGVVVGHLDTGVDGNHPALQGKIAGFGEFDNLGALMAAVPAYDSDNHGTHTAGTILGRSFQGVNIGVAPEARLRSALVLPGGSGSFAQIIGGMEWLIDEGVDVMNLSLGANGYFNIWNIPILISVLSGVNVVASIGNSGHGTSGGPGNDFLAIGVGATHDSDQAAGFSGGQTLLNVPHDILSPIFGLLTYQKPDISAPGVSVLSCIPGEGIAAFNGTSMAAPHVAGAIALLLSAEPLLRGEPFTVRNILLGAGREDFGDQGKDQRFGFGRLDALSAAEAAVSLVS